MNAQFLKPGFIALGALSLALSGCAYKPLKAPCSPDEGQPLAFAPQTPRSLSPQPMPISSAFQSLDTCGPMKPI